MESNSVATSSPSQGGRPGVRRTGPGACAPVSDTLASVANRRPDRRREETRRPYLVEHPYVVFAVLMMGLLLAYLAVAAAVHWMPFQKPKPAGFVASFDLMEGVKAADDIERLVAFLDREQTKVVFLRITFQPDVAQIAPRSGTIKSIHFKSTCWLARHSRIGPKKNLACENLRLDVIRDSSGFDLGTARWLTVWSAHVEGYFRVGLNVSAMGYNRIQVAPAVKPE